MKYQTSQNNYYTVSLQPVWKMCVGHVGGTRHRRSRIIPYMSVLVNDDNIPNQTKQLLHCISTTSRDNVRRTRWWDTRSRSILYHMSVLWDEHNIPNQTRQLLVLHCLNATSMENMRGTRPWDTLVRHQT